MTRLRRAFFVVVLLAAIAVPPVAEAGCAGTTCGAVCEDYACIVITDTYDTLACKPVANAGCMSMNSLTCCPRIPRE
jgi:hypothetical protein